jgi:hypothetical protein
MVALARAVASAVKAVEGIAELNDGQFDQAVTYGPNEKVPGVVVNFGDGAVDVEAHVTAQYVDSLVLSDLAARVRQSIGQAVADSGAGRLRRIDIVFEDICTVPDSPG